MSSRSSDAAIDGLRDVRVLPDSNVLSGDAMARVEYRRDGQRNWKHFLVLLDDALTFEMVEANVDQMIALYEAKS